MQDKRSGDRATKWLLLYRDMTVLVFDSALAHLEVIEPRYLPYGLRQQPTAQKLGEWLAARATPITRENASYLYSSAGVDLNEQGQYTLSREFGALSINDCFWVRRASENPRWQDISPYRKEALATQEFGYAMLTGESTQKTGLTRFSPEATLQGNWPKCLKSTEAGMLLYKDNDGDTTEIETAKLARDLGLAAPEYWAENYADVPCTVCRILSDEKRQWISAAEIGAERARALFPDQYSTMQTFDFIIGNADRHGLNWGWVVDEELRPLSLTPLYDFNAALHGVEPTRPSTVDRALLEALSHYLASYPETPHAGFYLQQARKLEDM